MFPMQRGAALVEQPGFGQHVRAAGDAADGDAFAGKPPEPGEGRLVGERRRIAAGADEHQIGLALGVGAAIGDDGDAVRGRHRLAAGGGVPPAVKLPARQQIGGAQRLDRRGIGHQREARHQQEAHGLRAAQAPGRGSRLAWRSWREMSIRRREMSIQSPREGARSRHALFGLQPARQCGHRQPPLETDLARARAQARLRRGDRRRRRAWPRHRALSRQGARHHQCRGGREVLYRLRQCRAQHHHRPLQLSACPAICRSTSTR